MENIIAEKLPYAFHIIFTTNSDYFFNEH